MGEAESDAILAPAATAAFAVRELRAAEAARGGLPPLPAESLAQTKVSSQAGWIWIGEGGVFLASCLKRMSEKRGRLGLESQAFFGF